MICPQCRLPTRVLESRRAEGGAATRRRRACGACGRRFTTFERIELGPAWVRKRDGSRQRFDPAKLRRALTRAAHKRDVAADDLEAIIRAVAASMQATGGELASGGIAEICLARLRELDHGAYLQFAGTLPSGSPHFAAIGGGPEPVGSVRASGHHPESTPKAVPRRDLDG